MMKDSEKRTIKDSNKEINKNNKIAVEICDEEDKELMEITDTMNAMKTEETQLHVNKEVNNNCVSDKKNNRSKSIVSNEKIETVETIDKTENDSQMMQIKCMPVLERNKISKPHKEFTLTKSAISLLENKGYHDLEVIGHGSYGKIYKAVSDKQKRDIAIKIVDMNKYSEAFLNKFLSTEKELMEKLPKHPNILEFIEMFEGKPEDDLHLFYIVMEYCPNGDLHDYIEKRVNIPEYQSCQWFRQIISAVEHIHKNGFAHRDVKSENLLLNHCYDLKLTDFGFCGKLRFKKESNFGSLHTTIGVQEERSRTFCGSYIYASPELLLGLPYLPTMNDIWSCGVILYVMSFGSYPNDGHELKRFSDSDHYSVQIPNYPQVSNECKQLIKNILTNEKNRITIDKIKQSKWFVKEWKQVENQKSDYFKNINIKRITTDSFEYTKTQIYKRHNMSNEFE